MWQDYCYINPIFSKLFSLCYLLLNFCCKRIFQIGPTAMLFASVYCISFALMFSSVTGSFSIEFPSGLASYELLKIKNKNTLSSYSGGQAFVRLAKVVSCPAGFKFQENDTVAIKIALPGSEEALQNEVAAHDHIRKFTVGKGIDGVVKVEEGLGVSSNLNEESNLQLPETVSPQPKYSILVMEFLGKDLLFYYFKNFPPNQSHLLAMHQKLKTILKALSNIGLIHGDVKPANILLDENDDPEAPITLIDFGLALFEGSKIKSCAGDLIYVSPAQMLLSRSATYQDCLVSSVYTILYLAAGDLTWVPLCNDSGLEASKRKSNLHSERIAIAKYCFNRRWWWYMGETIMQPDLTEAMQATLDEATSLETAAAAISDAVTECVAFVTDITTRLMQELNPSQ